MSLVLIVSATALVACVAVAVVVAFHERIVYQPPWFSGAPTAAGVRTIEYGGNGPSLRAYVIEAPAPVMTVIGFHGNAVPARWLLPWAKELTRRLPARVILPEYRGYDGLKGRPSHAGIADDARAAFLEVCSRYRLRPGEVVLFGHSLGSAIAAEVAAEHGCAALVLQSPFTSVQEMATRWPVPGLAAAWPRVARVHYDTRARLQELPAPVFIAHGTRDTVIPVHMGRALFEAARIKGHLFLVVAGHNDVPERGGEAYWRWLANALSPAHR